MSVGNTCFPRDLASEHSVPAGPLNQNLQEVPGGPQLVYRQGLLKGPPPSAQVGCLRSDVLK